MKTPRQVLLDMHAPAQKQLDRIRARTLAAALGRKPALSRGLSPSILARWVWNDLILACKPAWPALAAIWVGILGLNLATPRSSGAAAHTKAPPPSQVSTGLNENRRILADLLDRPPAVIHKHSILKPRTARREPTVIC